MALRTQHHLDDVTEASFDLHQYYKIYAYYNIYALIQHRRPTQDAKEHLLDYIKR